MKYIVKEVKIKDTLSNRDLEKLSKVLFDKIVSLSGNGQFTITLEDDSTKFDIELMIDYIEEDGVAFYVEGPEGIDKLENSNDYVNWKFRGEMILKLSTLGIDKNMELEEATNIVNELTNEELSDYLTETAYQAYYEGDIDVDWEYDESEEPDYYKIKLEEEM